MYPLWKWLRHNQLSPKRTNKGRGCIFASARPSGGRQRWQRINACYPYQDMYTYRGCGYCAKPQRGIVLKALISPCTTITDSNCQKSVAKEQHSRKMRFRCSCDAKVFLSEKKSPVMINRASGNQFGNRQQVADPLRYFLPRYD